MNAIERGAQPVDTGLRGIDEYTERLDLGNGGRDEVKALTRFGDWCRGPCRPDQIRRPEGPRRQV